MAKLFMFIFIALVAATSPAAALESPWASADYIQARLLSGFSATGDEAHIPAGLEIRLGDGWHAYWRTPGDGGLAPVLSWDGSDNLDAVAISWPAPERFNVLDLNSFGYAHNVVLPLDVVVKEPGKPVHLALKADIMVCKNICMPQSVNLALDIPAGEAAPDPDMQLIRNAAARVPQKGDLPGLKIENVVIGPDALVATAFSQDGYEDADLFVEAGDMYVTAPPEIIPDKDDPRKAMLRVAAPKGIDDFVAYMSRNDVTLTLVAGRRSIERTIKLGE